MLAKPSAARYSSRRRFGVYPDSQVDGFKRTARLPTWTPEHDASLETALAAHAAKAVATATPPAQADKGAVPPTPTGSDKATVESGGSVSGESVAGGDKGATPPPPADAPDLSWLPDEVRSKVHFDDDETHAKVKSGFMAHSAATAKFTEAARLREEAKAIERDAANYRVLSAHPRAKDIVKAVVEGGDVPEPQPTREPVDTSDPAAVLAELDRTKAEAKAEVDKLREELTGPARHRQAVIDTLRAFEVDNSVPEKVMTEAVAAADAYLLSKGRKWNPETAADLVAGYVEVARAKYATKPPPVPAPTGQPAVPPNGHTGTAEVASPTGSGGPHNQGLVPLPSFYVNGKMPNRPLTAAEWNEQDLYRMRERYGPGVTPEQIRIANRT